MVDKNADGVVSLQTVMVGMNPGEKLTKFIERKIRPVTKHLEEYSKKVDELVRTLQRSFKGHEHFSIRRIVKAGSLAKGTAICEKSDAEAIDNKGDGSVSDEDNTLVKVHSGSAEATANRSNTDKKSADYQTPDEDLARKSDIDLIVFFNGINNIEGLKLHMDELLKLLRDSIEGHPELNEKVRFKDKSSFTITFTFEGHDVDLLPAWDIFNQRAGNPDEKAKLFSEMKKQPKDVRRYYYQCLSPYQVEFVKELSAKVKDVIRLLKYWYKVEDVPLPNAFCLELMVVAEWRRRNKPDNIDMDDFFKSILRELYCAQWLRISFSDNYNLDHYQDPTRKGSYILDPSNPFRNTIAGLEGRRLKKVSEKAKQTLDRLVP